MLTGDWDPYSAIPNYYKLPDRTTFKNGQWVYGKDAYEKPYKVATGGYRKNGQKIYRIEVPTKKRKARKAYEERQQAEVDKLAADREAVVAKQLQRKRELEAQQAAAIAANQERAEKLRKQQAERVAAMKAKQSALKIQTAEQQEAAQASMELANERRALAMAAGESVASSLQVLSGKQGKQGKTATQSKRRRGFRGSRQTTASLSIGQTGTGGGSGSNLSI